MNILPPPSDPRWAYYQPTIEHVDEAEFGDDINCFTPSSIASSGAPSRVSVIDLDEVDLSTDENTPLSPEGSYPLFNGHV